ncbi:unnamed protein product [Linum trigynum]|uniref:Uncharacterized protein n=1 Tax=Linum trigynum TaxID=586398 RepID=A0AAV2DBU3_9ROSI
MKCSMETSRQASPTPRSERGTERGSQILPESECFKEEIDEKGERATFLSKFDIVQAMNPGKSPAAAPSRSYASLLRVTICVY